MTHNLTPIPASFCTFTRSVRARLRDSFNRADAADLTLDYLDIVSIAYESNQSAKDAAGAIATSVQGLI